MGEARTNRKTILRINKELSTLDAVATAVSQSLFLDVISDAALEKVLETLKIEGGALFLLGEQTEELTLKVHRGLSEAFVQGLAGLKTGGSFAGLVAPSGEPVVVQDVSEAPGPVEMVAQKEGFHSLVHVPLKSKDKMLGLMTLVSCSYRRFGAEDIPLLSGIGEKIGIAIGKAHLYEQVQRQAITDGLTGLYNYRYFYESLARELERSKRYDHRFSLIMLDIDHFKQYNDTFGHLEGDAALKAVADVLRDNVRSADIPARYGGEEFIVILPEIARGEAFRAAERIHSVVEAYPFSRGKVLISLGVASYPEDGETAEQLIQVADQCLYQAKLKGGNTVCASSGTKEG